MSTPVVKKATLVALFLGALVGFAVSWALEEPALWTRSVPRTLDEDGARASLSRAKAALGTRDLAAAKRALVRCVELGDLPECHARLGVLLSLQGDPRAQHHLERGGLTGEP